MSNRIRLSEFRIALLHKHTARCSWSTALQRSSPSITVPLETPSAGSSCTGRWPLRRLLEATGAALSAPHMADPQVRCEPG